jgi:hypothetical protein
MPIEQYPRDRVDEWAADLVRNAANSRALPGNIEDALEIVADYIEKLQREVEQADYEIRDLS